MLFEKTKSLLSKFLLSLEIYLTLIMLALIFLKILLPFEAGDLNEAFLLLFFYGIFGGFCFFDSCDFFLFPFAPAIISLGTIFIIVHFANKNDYFSKYKRKIFIIITSILILAFICNGVLSYMDNKEFTKKWEQINEERVAYLEKYGTTEKIESNQEFIRIEKKSTNEYQENPFSVIISKIDGTQSRKLSVLSERDNASSGLPYFISPKGNYYLRLKEWGRNGADVLNLNGTLFFNFSTLLNEEDNILPFDNLKWANNERYIARLIDGLQTGPGCYVSDLILYDLLDQKKYLIGKPFSCRSVEDINADYNYQSSFDWADDSKSIFFSDYYGLHMIKNVDEITDSYGIIEPKEVLISNITYCGNIAYSSNKIYCSIHIEKLGIIFEDKENIEAEDKDYFVISQEANQNYLNSYTLVNKAPIKDIEYIFPIDKRYLILKTGWNYEVLIDITTGKQRKLFSKSLSSDDEGLIFAGSNEKDSGENPIKYVGN